MSFLDTYTKYDLPDLTDGVILPEFIISDEYKKKYNLTPDCTHYQFLLALCQEGIEKKIGKNHPQYKSYYERMKYELNSLEELGFCSYLLLTWEIINHCRLNNIPTGAGRGSSAGSLVLYLVDVTKIDSLKYGLYFERFLNKTRAKFTQKGNVRYYQGDLLMDIDLDISDCHRDLLIQWLNKRYEGRVCKIATLNTFTTKILVKEVSKAYLNINEYQANIISESIPVFFGKSKDIDTTITLSEEFKKFADENPEVIKLSKQLYQLPKHFGAHASAWIISASPLDESIPLKLTKDKELATVYTMEDTTDLAIKVDILGLRCATLIDLTCKLVGIKMEDIDVNDPMIYEKLQNLECPHGIFQIEADCNYGVLKKIKPKNLEHLSAVVSIARPGALSFTDVFAEYVQTGKFQSVHPFFDDVLKDTAGIPIYQESLLRMAHKVGFSLIEAETIRRVIGKKKVDDMPEWKEKVEKKVKENNLDPAVGDILWELMDASKDYSFNFSHGLAYATMAAATVYLKFKHPKQFFLALLELSKEKDTLDEISKIQTEMQQFGIKLLGPDIIKSQNTFSIEGEDIRFGLGYIKGIGDKFIEKLPHFKHEYSTKFDIFSAAQEIGLNIGVLSSMIAAGCLDRFITSSRSRTVLEAQAWSILTPRELKKVIELGPSNNYDVLKIISDLTKVKNEDGKTFIKESRLETIRKKYEPYKEIYKQNSRHEKLACHFYEKLLLGYSYSARIEKILQEYYPELVGTKEASTELEDSWVTVGGEVIEVINGVAKNQKKTKYQKVIVQDSEGTITCMLFNDNIKSNEELNNLPLEAKQVVVCRGKRKKDAIFADRIINQNIKIYMKLADINKTKTKEIVDKTN